MVTDPDFQYRTNPGMVPVLATSQFTQDDADQSTLISVLKDLQAAMDNIDKWHAFDLKGNETSLTVEQQIIAHQRAYEMVAPAYEAVKAAVALTDSKFREN